LHHVGEAIVSALDDHGYFRGDLDDLADAVGVTSAEAERALAILQHLDPPGIGARSLAECLRCQAERPDAAEPPGTLQFIEQCLDGGPREMRQAARTLLGLSDDAIGEILGFLRDHLHPYPVRLLDADSAHNFSAPMATADVVLTDEGGALAISVPQSERLQVRIDRIYAGLEERLRRRRHLGEHEQHVREKVRAARELIALLQRRHETLALVAEAIIKHQMDYFATGDAQRLRPLDQKTIARATGLHESTVCRALKGKSVLLPDGALVPFELFFDESLPAKVVLQRMIAEEPTDRPHSDEALTHMMRACDFPLARRTVTKYRLQMSIPPAHARKRSSLRRARLCTV
jgi:RNA polymerase sigma-54 factor